MYAGLTDKANPCFDVRRNKEKPRDYYAGETVWNAVYAEAVQEFKDAMDLAYLTGQRPADVLKIAATDLNNGFLLIGQGKTEKRLHLRLEDAGIQSGLSSFIDDLQERRAVNGIRTSTLITNASGLRMSQQMLRMTASGRCGRLGSLVSSTIPRPIEERHNDNGVLNFPKKGSVAEVIRKIAKAMSKSQTIKNPVDVNLRGFQEWRPRSESNRRRRICNPLHNHFATRPQTINALTADIHRIKT